LKIENDVNDSRVGNENVGPYEFKIHTFVVYDYLGIVVLHFTN
jgi:hypothetical protein